MRSSWRRQSQWYGNSSHELEHAATGNRCRKQRRKAREAVTATEQQELVAAIGSKEWHKTLHYLRLCAPVFPIVTLARLRGTAYDAIGLPAYAKEVHKRAAEVA